MTRKEQRVHIQNHVYGCMINVVFHFNGEKMDHSIDASCIMMTLAKESNPIFHTTHKVFSNVL